MKEETIRFYCNRCPVESFCDYIKQKIEKMNDVKDWFCPLLSLIRQHVLYACGIREYGEIVLDYDEEEVDEQ